jgi:hypothetical protein
LPIGKKSNRAAVGRPERIAGSFGARERLRRHLVEGPYPQSRRCLRNVATKASCRPSADSASDIGSVVGGVGNLKTRQKRRGHIRRKYRVATIANAAAITSDSAATIKASARAAPAGCVAKSGGFLCRAADEFFNLHARVSDRLEPRLRILPSTSAQQLTQPRRCRGGSAAQFGSRSITFASTSEIVSPSNAGRPVSIS